MAARKAMTIEPPILLAAPWNALGLGDGDAPPAAEVAPPATEVATVLGDVLIKIKLTLGSPVPVPKAPLDEAEPVG
jgi:hypothetical protein